MTRDEQLAQTIGEVCLAWADIETLVHDMALHLAAYGNRAYDDDLVRHPLHVALSEMKLRERIHVAKALAHEVHGDYYDRFSSLLNTIDTELTLERNRYVHDMWDTDGNVFLRFKPGPKVVRPQARQRVLMMGTEKQFKDISEVRKFIDHLEEAKSSLIEFENELAGLMIEQDSRG